MLLQKQNLIHFVLHVLLISESLSHLSLCSKSSFAAVSNPAVFSASLESTFLQQNCSGQASWGNSLSEGFALWIHEDKPLVSSTFLPSPTSIMHVCTHTRWLMVQFKPCSTGICSLSSQPASQQEGMGRVFSSETRLFPSWERRSHFKPLFICLHLKVD